MPKKATYRVTYHVLEPSYYDRSERVYTSQDFTDREEALGFAEEAKKKWPAQILVTCITEETLLDLRDTDDYKENRAPKN